MADRRVRVVFEFRSKMQHAEIRCACGRVVLLPPGIAIALLGATTELRTVEGRLRCLWCGQRRARISGVYREYHG